MKIVTLTLNPAMDIHCDCDDFRPFGESLAVNEVAYAGGKGLNVSRALHAAGVDSEAVLVLGEDNRADFEQKLKEEKLPYTPIGWPGRIRENITLHTSGKPETRISFAGFSADASLLSKVEAALPPLEEGDVLTLTGRDPEGLDIEDVKDFLLRQKKKGVRIVIDSRSFGLDDILAVKPYLIKPNDEEIAAYTGREISSLSDAAEAASALRAGGIDNVMITLGGDGAVLSCDEGVFTSLVPPVEVLSTVGAGDSSIAGFLAAEAWGASAPDKLHTAVAFGSAACRQAGTAAPAVADIDACLGFFGCKRGETE